MNETLMLVGHPDIEKNSIFNKIIVDSFQNIKEVRIKNIMKEYPDFKIDIKREQEILIEVENIVFQFPLYWYSMPAIMKEWIDRVFEYGFACGSKGDKLKGKNCILSITIGGPKSSYLDKDNSSFSMESLLSPLEKTINFCGMNFLNPILSYDMFYNPNVPEAKSKIEEKAQKHVQRLRDILEKL